MATLRKLDTSSLRTSSRLGMRGSISRAKVIKRAVLFHLRSEERRVGKECSCRRSAYQAEDGIRDGHVTGVQTCALPISHRLVHAQLHRAVHRRVVGGAPGADGDLAEAGHVVFAYELEVGHARQYIACKSDKTRRAVSFEIGRASCRERV